jgi:hypothetical protein
MPTPQTEYRTIPLTQGQFALVDAADYDWLMQWKWHAHWNKTAKSYYAMRQSPRGKEGKQCLISMHRQILDLHSGDKRQGDHSNHDTLNNCRDNLRIASHTESSRNRRTRADNTSGYKGVFVMRGQCYARITIDKMPVILGWFSNTPEGHLAASEAYKEAAKKHFGEFYCEL